MAADSGNHPGIRTGCSVPAGLSDCSGTGSADSGKPDWTDCSDTESAGSVQTGCSGTVPAAGSQMPADSASCNCPEAVALWLILRLVLYRLWILHGKVLCSHIAVIIFIRIHILFSVGVLFVHKSYPLSDTFMFAFPGLFVFSSLFL